MDSKAIKEVFNELFSHLERLETQNEAILQFLKEKKSVTDKELAPYLEQAGNAANVRWRAARIRIEHLLEDKEKEKEIELGKKPEIAAAETAKKEAGKTETAQAEVTNSPQAAPENKKAESQQAENKKPEQPKESSHPTEMTESLAQSKGAEPPAELSAGKKSGDKEAA
jgi:hypothetical protein